MEQTRPYVIVAAVLIGTAVMGRDVSGQPAARMTVHLVDYGRLSADDLKEAQREAREIYAAAGIDLVWHLGNTEDHPRTGVDVRVVLLDGPMSKKKINEGRLGEDVLGVGGQAGWAYIFVVRVMLRSVSAQACFPRVLGRVIAHELGHVVLPVPGHTSTGIMRASVDMQPRGERYFTETQAAHLLRNVIAAH